MSNTARPLTAQAILTPIANLHVMTASLLDDMDRVAAELRELALANVAQAINNGETAIPAISIELFAKADAMPDLRAVGEAFKQKIEAILVAGATKAPGLRLQNPVAEPVEAAPAAIVPAAAPAAPIRTQAPAPIPAMNIAAVAETLEGSLNG